MLTIIGIIVYIIIWAFIVLESGQMIHEWREQKKMIAFAKQALADLQKEREAYIASKGDGLSQSSK